MTLWHHDVMTSQDGVEGTFHVSFYGVKITCKMAESPRQHAEWLGVLFTRVSWCQAVWLVMWQLGSKLWCQSGSSSWTLAGWFSDVCWFFLILVSGQWTLWHHNRTCSDIRRLVTSQLLCDIIGDHVSFVISFYLVFFYQLSSETTCVLLPLRNWTNSAFSFIIISTFIFVFFFFYFFFTSAAWQPFCVGWNQPITFEEVYDVETSTCMLPQSAAWKLTLN